VPDSLTLVRPEALCGLLAERKVILEHLAACFEPGLKYPEKAVDAILRAWHPDYASLRRYLVDEGMLDREHAVYWRSGGPVDV
jgi:hypothetical protein